jgi:hypothetical protein
MFRATRTLAAAAMAEHANEQQQQQHRHASSVGDLDLVRSNSNDVRGNVSTAFQPHMVNMAFVSPEPQAQSQSQLPPRTSQPAAAPSPPILCEYLSPRVLKKEIIHLLEVRPARYFCTRSFRKNSAVLFWNLMWSATFFDRSGENNPLVLFHACCVVFCIIAHLVVCVCSSSCCAQAFHQPMSARGFPDPSRAEVQSCCVSEPALCCGDRCFETAAPWSAQPPPAPEP